MPVTIHVPKPETKERRLESLRAPRRPATRVQGGWIADLTGLKQTIMLCPFCEGKFNPRAHQYELWRREWLAIAQCDACKQHSRATKVFIHASLHDAVGEAMPRKRGRWVRRSA